VAALLHKRCHALAQHQQRLLHAATGTGSGSNKKARADKQEEQQWLYELRGLQPLPTCVHDATYQQT
jgi:hypothetical protein